VVSGGAKSRQAAEEAFYGFGDFFRDLDKDRCLPECLMHELKDPASLQFHGIRPQ